MSIAITGICGFVGSELALQLGRRFPGSQRGAGFVLLSTSRVYSVNALSTLPNVLDEIAHHRLHPAWLSLSRPL